MPEYKKQHFVPQFYFRLFSQDGTIINQFNLDHKQVNIVQIKDVCQKKYFYGKNHEIEKDLSILEYKHSLIINEIITNKRIPNNSQDYFELLRFICFQEMRTNKSKQAANQTVELFSEEVIKPMMLEAPKLIKEGITPEFLKKIKITHPGMFFYRLILGMGGAILLTDLTPLLLLNKTNFEFIFSDSPVNLYNLKYKAAKSGHKGLQSSGLLIFCPLDPKIMLLLFDSYLYNIKRRPNKTLKIKTPRDIIALNTLQFFNCFNNVYFANKNQERVILGIFKKYAKLIAKTRKHLVEWNHFIQKMGGGSKEIIHMSTPNIRYNLKTSFIKIKQNVPQTLWRDELLAKQFEAFMKGWEQLMEKHDTCF